MSQRSALTLPAAVCGLGVVCLLLTWFWLVPTVRTQSAELGGRQQEKAALSERVQQLEAIRTVLAQDPGTTGALPLSYEDIIRSLPEDRLYEDLYAMIEQTINEAGLATDSTIGINKVADTEGAAVAATPVALTLRGSYEQIKQILDRLTVTLRPLSLNTVVMAPDETGAITTTITATAYTRGQATAPVAPATGEVGSTGDQMVPAIPQNMSNL